MEDYAQEIFSECATEEWLRDVSGSLSCFHDLTLWPQRQSKKEKRDEMAFREKNEFSDMNRWYKRLLWRRLPWEAWVLRL